MRTNSEEKSKHTFYAQRCFSKIAAFVRSWKKAWRSRTCHSRQRGTYALYGYKHTLRIHNNTSATSGFGWRNGLHYGEQLRIYWISSRGQPKRSRPQAVSVSTDCLLFPDTERGAFTALEACICRDILWELWNWGQRWRRSCRCFRMCGGLVGEKGLEIKEGIGIFQLAFLNFFILNLIGQV